MMACMPQTAEAQDLAHSTGALLAVACQGGGERPLETSRSLSLDLSCGVRICG